MRVAMVIPILTHKKKPPCETYHTAAFCLIQAQLAITDGCWSGKAMLLLEPGRSWQLALAPLPGLLLFQLLELLLAWLLLLA